MQPLPAKALVIPFEVVHIPACYFPVHHSTWETNSMIVGKPLVALLSGVTVAAARSRVQTDSSQFSLKPSSPVSHVEGLVFNRFVNIWLENVVSFPGIRQSLMVITYILLGLYHSCYRSSSPQSGRERPASKQFLGYHPPFAAQLLRLSRG